MNVLYLGELSGNTGPSNANLGFYSHWPAQDSLNVFSTSSKLKKVLDALMMPASCDCVISFGNWFLFRCSEKLAKLQNKPRIVFCHGYAPYENEINQLGLSDRYVRSYVNWLEEADIVVANSAYQARFILEQQPSLRGRVCHVNLGVERFVQELREHNNSSHIVAVSGGTRKIKGNDVVARSVYRLRRAGVDVRLHVYGRRYATVDGDLDRLISDGYGEYKGQVSHEQFIEGLAVSDVFVMNSRHEPFGLSAIDALQAGSSLLLSKNCGVKGLLKLESNDIVENCEDDTEVADKIAHLLNKSNSKRLYESIDFEEASWDSAAQKLREVCARAAGIAL